MIVTEVFRPLVEAQAKARGASPNLLVVRHPVGGLNREELEARIEQASAALMRALANEAAAKQ